MQVLIRCPHIVLFCENQQPHNRVHVELELPVPVHVLEEPVDLQLTVYPAKYDVAEILAQLYAFLYLLLLSKSKIRYYSLAAGRGRNRKRFQF